MADDPSKRGPQEPVSYQHKRRPRSYAIGLKSSGVSPERLKAAVKKVGNSAKAVEKELKAGVAS